MIDYMIPLLKPIASSGFFQYLILPLFGLSVGVVIPRIIRYFIGLRR